MTSPRPPVSRSVTPKWALAVLVVLALGMLLALPKRNQATLIASASEQTQALAALDRYEEDLRETAADYGRDLAPARVASLERARLLVAASSPSFGLHGVMTLIALVLIALRVALAAWEVPLSRVIRAPFSLRPALRDFGTSALPASLGLMVAGALLGGGLSLSLGGEGVDRKLFEALAVADVASMGYLPWIGPIIALAAVSGLAAAFLTIGITLLRGDSLYRTPSELAEARAKAQASTLGKWIIALREAIRQLAALGGVWLLLSALGLFELGKALALPGILAALLLMLVSVGLLRLLARSRGVRTPSAFQSLRVGAGALVSQHEMVGAREYHVDAATTGAFIPYALLQRGCSMAMIVALTLGALQLNGVEPGWDTLLVCAGMALPSLWLMRRSAADAAFTYLSMAPLLALGGLGEPALIFAALLAAPVAIACDALVSAHLAALAAATPAFETFTQPQPEAPTPARDLRLVR